MANKKGIVTNTLIIIILMVVVLLAVLMFIYKVNILDWLRNLPDYTYDEDREVNYTGIDEAAIEGICLGEALVGFIGKLEGTMGFREQNLSFITEDKDGKKWDVETGLYWRGTGKEAEIWLLQKDGIFNRDWFKADLKVAEVEEGIIKIKPELLDLESEMYQRTRFSGKRPKELYFIPKLNGSYVAGNNKICRIAEETKLKPAWPESAGINVISLHLKIRIEKLRFRKDKYKIELSPYAEPIRFKYLHIVDGKGVVEIKGEVTGPDKTVGRIYPDGSVWFDEKGLTGKIGMFEIGEGAKLNLNENFKIRYNKYYWPYNESNIKIDNYALIKNLVK